MSPVVKKTNDDTLKYPTESRNKTKWYTIHKKPDWESHFSTEISDNDSEDNNFSPCNIFLQYYIILKK